MQGTRQSGAGVAFVVLLALIQLAVAGSLQTLRRGLLWAAVGVMAAVLVTLGLVASATARVR